MPQSTAATVSASVVIITGAGQSANIELLDAYDAPVARIVSEINAFRPPVSCAPSLDAVLPPQAGYGVADFKAPWLSILLMVIFVLVFAAETVFAIVPGSVALSPTNMTLDAFGVLSPRHLLSGQWYRIFISPFLHVSLIQLIYDCEFIVLSGVIIEKMVGRAWTACIFSFGVVAGSVGALMDSPPWMLSAGASGGIMAMLAAASVLTFRLPAGLVRSMSLYRAVIFLLVYYVIVGLLAPAWLNSAGGAIGGAVTGAALGLLLRQYWCVGNALPDYRGSAAVLATTLALTFLVSAFGVASAYQSYPAATAMIPEADTRQPAKAMMGISEYFLTTYPRDPRSHYWDAMARFAQKDLTGAEQSLRAAMHLVDIYPGWSDPPFRALLQAQLARMAYMDGRVTEAKVIAREACAATGPAAADPSIWAEVARFRLCDTRSGIPGR